MATSAPFAACVHLACQSGAGARTLWQRVRESLWCWRKDAAAEGLGVRVRLPRMASMPGRDADILYPAPRVKWHVCAERHPSLQDAFGPLGFELPLVLPASTPKSAPKSDRAAAAVSQHLVISVLSAVGLEPPGRGCELLYRAAAHYQNEGPEAIERRKTPPSRAGRSARDPSALDCEIDGKIRVPFDSRQQFVKVVIYHHDKGCDRLIGEATVPIADQRVSSIAPWTLMHDFEPMGDVILTIGEPAVDTPRQGADEVKFPKPPSGTVVDDFSSPASRVSRMPRACEADASRPLESSRSPAFPAAHGMGAEDMECLRGPHGSNRGANERGWSLGLNEEDEPRFKVTAGAHDLAWSDALKVGSPEHRGRVVQIEDRGIQGLLRCSVSLCQPAVDTEPGPRACEAVSSLVKGTSPAFPHQSTQCSEMQSQASESSSEESSDSEDDVSPSPAGPKAAWEQQRHMPSLGAGAGEHRRPVEVQVESRAAVRSHSLGASLRSEQTCGTTYQSAGSSWASGWQGQVAYPSAWPHGQQRIASHVQSMVPAPVASHPGRLLAAPPTREWQWQAPPSQLDAAEHKTPTSYNLRAGSHPPASCLYASPETSSAYSSQPALSGSQPGATYSIYAAAPVLSHHTVIGPTVTMSAGTGAHATYVQGTPVAASGLPRGYQPEGARYYYR